MGFLLDAGVIVHTRSKQELHVTDGCKLWKYHVLSLHLPLPNPDIHQTYIVLCLMSVWALGFGHPHHKAIDKHQALSDSFWFPSSEPCVLADRSPLSSQSLGRSSVPEEGKELWVMFSFRDSNSHCCFCVSYQSFKILACAAGVNTKEQMKSWESPFAKLWVLKPNTVMAANTTVLPHTQKCV